MIQLQIHRFDEARRMLALRQAEGNRFLFLCFGESEAAEIGRAMRGDPPQLEAVSADWMNTIRQWGAKLESATITNLVDGAFQASVRLSHDGQTVDMLARPADAIAAAIRLGSPILATAELLQIAGIYLHPDAIESMFSGRTLALEDGQIGPPACALQQRKSPLLTVAASYLAPIGWAIISLIVFSTTVELIVAGVLHFYAGGVPEIARRLAFYLAIYATLALFAGLLIHLRRMNREQELKLEIFPIGLRIAKDKSPHYLGWSAFARAGELSGFFGSTDGLLYWKDARTPSPGIALSPYESNWREGEIGRLIRRYAPRLLGIQPPDPDGGRPIF
jgi:bifunctional DNase/RNase